jgi:SAM-dependent methyltransferase
MRLSPAEFKAMNNSLRRLVQRTVEFPLFQRLGLQDQGGDILEIGCGSGYGAVLLSQLHPHSYVGIDLMPEQIALARQYNLPETHFLVQSAGDLGNFPAGSKDTVVIFGVLHHIPEWRSVLDGCYRVLRPGGKLFLEEPDGGVLKTWEGLFRWGHPLTDILYLKEMEAYLQRLGFVVQGQRYLFGFGVYGLQKAVVQVEPQGG